MLKIICQQTVDRWTEPAKDEPPTFTLDKRWRRRVYTTLISVLQHVYVI